MKPLYLDQALSRFSAEPARISAFLALASEGRPTISHQTSNHDVAD
jgi:hypothetical protein